MGDLADTWTTPRTARTHLQAEERRHLVRRQADHGRGRGLDDQHDGQVQGRPDRGGRGRVGHPLVKAEATDPTTLVVTTTPRWANALPQLQTVFILPEARVGAAGHRRRQAAEDVRAAGAAAVRLRRGLHAGELEKKGTVVFRPNPNYYGTTSTADAIVLRVLHERGRDDRPTSRPARSSGRRGAVIDGDQAVKDSRTWSVIEIPGPETTNITWNSNPRKTQNRELLDPKVKQALSRCVDREKIIDVVFAGYANTVESLSGTSRRHGEPEPRAAEVRLRGGQPDAGQARLQARPGRHPDGAGDDRPDAQPAHPMKYPRSSSRQPRLQRRARVRHRQGGFAKLGVNVTLKSAGDATAAYAVETGRRPATPPRTPVATTDFDMAHVGLGRVHRPGLHALGGDPRPVVLVERHRRINPKLGRAVQQAGRDRRRGRAQADRGRDAADRLRQVLYTQLVNENASTRTQDVDEVQARAERVLEAVLDRRPARSADVNRAGADVRSEVRLRDRARAVRAHHGVGRHHAQLPAVPRPAGRRRLRRCAAGSAPQQFKEAQLQASSAWTEPGAMQYGCTSRPGPRRPRQLAGRREARVWS